MSARRRKAEPEGAEPDNAEPQTAEPQTAEPEPEVAERETVEPDDGGRHVIDLVPDEMALARGQLDAGLASLAEGTVRRRLARLEADGTVGPDEPDALRVLLAEALWRQGRLAGARLALDAIGAGSPQRRLPIAMLVEAEALAAAGEQDRATGAMERVVHAIGVDAAYEMRGDRPGRLTWPLPTALAPRAPDPPRAPWAADPDEDGSPDVEVDDERVALARARLEEARVAYVAGELTRGDEELSLAARLDPTLAADGVAILEPTLGGQPATDRLLLYGDLLRAAGREVEANEAYDRAAGQRS